MSAERDLFQGTPSKVLGKRPRPRTGPVTLEELKHFRRLIATVLLHDGEAVRPIFDRLDREIADWESKQGDLARIRALAEGATGLGNISGDTTVRRRGFGRRET